MNLSPRRQKDELVIHHSIQAITMAATMSNVNEFYNFFIFGVLGNELASKFWVADGDGIFLNWTATYFVGFFFRPLGAIIFGHIADVKGRKYAFYVTLLLTGLSTFLMGCLPTYDNWKYSGYLLIFLRCLQGLALGGEYGSSMVIVIENSPTKEKTFWTACVQSAGLCSFCFALLIIYIIRASCGQDQFLSYGWRIPFFLSFGFVGLAVYVFVFLRESPLFEELKEGRKVVNCPLNLLFFKAENLKMLASGFFSVSFGQHAMFYTTTFLVLTILNNPYSPTNLDPQKNMHVSTLNSYLIMLVPSILALPFFFLTGYFADKYGRRIFYTFSLLGSLIVWYPCFIGLDYYKYSATDNGQVNPQYNPFMLSFLVFIMMIFISIGNATIPSLLGECFETKIRTSGMNITYNFGTALGGGLVSVFAFIAINQTSNILSSLWFPLAGISLSLFCHIFFFKETLGIDLKSIGVDHKEIREEILTKKKAGLEFQKQLDAVYGNVGSDTPLSTSPDDSLPSLSAPSSGFDLKNAKLREIAQLSNVAILGSSLPDLQSLEGDLAPSHPFTLTRQSVGGGSASSLNSRKSGSVASQTTDDDNNTLTRSIISQSKNLEPGDKNYRHLYGKTGTKVLGRALTPVRDIMSNSTIFLSLSTRIVDAMFLLQNEMYKIILVDSMTECPDILTEDIMIKFLESRMQSENDNIDDLIQKLQLWELNLEKPGGIVKHDDTVKHCLSVIASEENNSKSNTLIVLDENDELAGIVTSKMIFNWLARDLEQNKMLREQALAMQLDSHGYDPETLPAFLASMLESTCYQLFMGIYLLIDVTLAIVTLILNTTTHDGFSSYNFSYEFVGLFTILLIEVCARFYILRWRFLRLYSIIDASFIIVSFVMAILRSFGKVDYYTYLPFIAARILFFLAQIYNRRLLLLPKKLVSGNKRRIMKGQFNLDLTYINERVVAMSWPATSFESAFRNKMHQVVEFLDIHHNENYWVYNLCNERDYDISHFHDRVLKVPMEDHNVPSFPQMIEFSLHTDFWLKTNPNNIVVIHCKGGKGRTGTMVCAALLKNHDFSDPYESLKYFKERRGEEVSGISQVRYVNYFAKYLATNMNYTESKKVISSIVLKNVFPDGKKKSMGSLTIKVYLNHGEKMELLYQSNSKQSSLNPSSASLFGTRNPSSASLSRLEDGKEQKEEVNYEEGDGTSSLTGSYGYDEEFEEDDLLLDESKEALLNENRKKFNFADGMEVSNDVKIEIFSKDKEIAFIWFNCCFISDKNEKVYRIKKKDIDKAAKDRKHVKFHPKFNVEINFSRRKNSIGSRKVLNASSTYTPLSSINSVQEITDKVGVIEKNYNKKAVEIDLLNAIREGEEKDEEKDEVIKVIVE